VKNPGSRSEYGEQCAVFQWADREVRWETGYLFATLNGVKLPVGLAVKVKRAGNRKGVPDIWLPVPRGDYHGLVIELKVKPNKPTIEQTEWLEGLKAMGYKALVCYGADEAIAAIKDYLGPR